MENKEIAVLFSGGTDSLLAAALMAEKFARVHLITYQRFGFFSIENSKLNVEKLKDKFGKDKFTHQIINIDKLSKYIFYERYFRNLIKYRFFLLSNCGLCKLAMHIRSILFCLDNKIENICDGANKNMDIFPAQMSSVVDEIKNMYRKFGIFYQTPVFEFDEPGGLSLADKLNLGKIFPGEKESRANKEEIKKTAGYELFRLGLMPKVNVKGSKLDKKMQARCFQLVLFNIFVRWYYMYNRSYKQYECATLEFFKDKIAFFIILISRYRENKAASRLYKLAKNN